MAASSELAVMSSKLVAQITGYNTINNGRIADKKRIPLTIIIVQRTMFIIITVALFTVICEFRTVVHNLWISSLWPLLNRIYSQVWIPNFGRVLKLELQLPARDRDFVALWTMTGLMNLLRSPRVSSNFVQSLMKITLGFLGFINIQELVH